jgi:hypothetical protein
MRIHRRGRRGRRGKALKHAHHLLCALCALCGAIAGCQTTETTDGDGPPLDPPRPYAELAADYNQRIALIERIWSRSVVEVEWIDREGKKQLEQGEGPLIVRKPGEMALAIGKLGVTRFWLGCDDERYWFFDLAEDRRTAYVGRQDRIATERSESLPLPIRPDRLIRLAGITPLPRYDDASAVRVERTPTGHRITLPADKALGGLVMRTTVDDACRATRIELLMPDGRLLIDAALSAFARMEITGQPPGAWPEIARRIRVALPYHRAEVSLFIEKLTDDPTRVKDVQFDFDKLTAALRVDRTVDIDTDPRAR